MTTFSEECNKSCLETPQKNPIRLSLQLLYHLTANFSSYNKNITSQYSATQKNKRYIHDGFSATPAYPKTVPPAHPKSLL